MTLAGPLSAYFTDDETISATAGGGEQPLHGLAHGLVRETEGAVVHGQHEIGHDLVGHIPGLLGVGVGLNVGVVAADADDGQIDLADVFEIIVVGRVSAVEDAAFAGFDEEGVEAAVVVVHGAGAPVADFLGGDFEARDVHGFAPA